MKSCSSCVHTGEPSSIKPDCFGTCLQNDASGRPQFLLHKEGDPVARRLQLERDGLIPIVIGGVGEAEVNAHRSMGEAYENLDDIACEVGYLVRAYSKENAIILTATHGVFRLQYTDDGSRLDAISVHPGGPVIWKGRQQDLAENFEAEEMNAVPAGHAAISGDASPAASSEREMLRRELEGVAGMPIALIKTEFTATGGSKWSVLCMTENAAMAIERGYTGAAVRKDTKLGGWVVEGEKRAPARSVSPSI